jgi:succinate dehydrogenase (ubiquinone) flavoprotein subunit
MAVKFVCLFFV